mgnify:CR=1 FL=1
MLPNLFHLNEQSYILRKENSKAFVQKESNAEVPRHVTIDDTIKNTAE